jgi:hypothetical protein
MNSESLPCPDCGAPYDQLDNYCRQCGMFVAALRAVAPAPQHNSRAVAAARPPVPAPMKKAAAAVAIGTALQIGVGLAGKYLAAQATKQALAAATPAQKPARRTQAKAQPARVQDPMADAAAVSETLLIRRVWIRRP